MRSSYVSRRGARRATQAGIALLEAMVGMLIFAFGVLGVVGLQATMSKAQAGAKHRAEAVNLAYELVGRMWADNPANLPSYDGDECLKNASCKEWDEKLKRMLPDAESKLSWDAANSEVNVVITWTRPGEGTSSYALRAVIAS